MNWKNIGGLTQSFVPVKPDSVDILAPVLIRYKAAQEGGRILYVTFTAVADYFWLLRAACEFLQMFGNRAILYLAAAVSDFYVPSSEMVSTDRYTECSQVSVEYMRLKKKKENETLSVSIVTLIT